MRDSLHCVCRASKVEEQTLLESPVEFVGALTVLREHNERFMPHNKIVFRAHAFVLEIAQRDEDWKTCKDLMTTISRPPGGSFFITLISRLP